MKFKSLRSINMRKKHRFIRTPSRGPCFRGASTEWQPTVNSFNRERSWQVSIFIYEAHLSSITRNKYCQNGQIASSTMYLSPCDLCSNFSN
jgi:hypothetical protein